MIVLQEKWEFAVKNVYQQYDGNQPFIFGSKNMGLKDNISVLKTDAPYLADKLMEQKNQIWNEAMTYLGISNVSYQKKERLISDEVTRSMGGTIASRQSRLEMRKEACDQINRMFGTNIDVDFREDYREFESEDMSEDNDNEDGKE